MVLGHGVSSLTWKVETLGRVSGCCIFCGILQLGTDGFSSPLGLLWGRGFLQTSPASSYIQSLEWIWLLISPLEFGLLQ